MTDLGGSPNAEQIIEETIEKYSEYINPSLASLMRFAGFGDVEESALGTIVKDYSEMSISIAWAVTAFSRLDIGIPK